MSQIRPNYFKGNLRFFSCRKGFFVECFFSQIALRDEAGPHWYKRQLAGGLFSNSTISQIVAVMQAN